MAACGYGFYFLVLKVSLTSERSERVRDTFTTHVFKLSNERKLLEKNSRKRYCDRGQI